MTNRPLARLPRRRGDAVLPPPVRARRAVHRPGSGRCHRRALGPPTPSVSAKVPGCCRGQAGKEPSSTSSFPSPDSLNLLLAFTLPLWVDLGGAPEEFRGFSGSLSSQSSQENFQSPESPLTSFFSISAVGHSSGKFFGIQENPKTRVAEQEGMRHPSLRAQRGGAGPGAESADL